MSLAINANSEYCIKKIMTPTRLDIIKLITGKHKENITFVGKRNRKLLMIRDEETTFDHNNK